MRVERVSVAQNYNNSNRQNFTARFPEKEIVSLAKDAKETYGAAGIPMLDILLGYLEKIGGKIAHIKSKKTEGVLGCTVKNKALAIDNKIVLEGDEYSSGIDLLKNHLVGEPAYDMQDFVPMPERIFEWKWFGQGTRDKEELLRHALPSKTPKTKKVIDWSKEKITSPAPEIAVLEEKVEHIKPYSVVKEIYRNKKGQKVLISNIDILSKSKTEEGIEELNKIEQNLNKTYKEIFAQKRDAAKLEIEKQKLKKVD